MRLLQIGVPVVTVLGFIVVSMLSSGSRGLLLIIPMLLSIVASVAFSLYSYRKERQKDFEDDKAYESRLIELNKEMNTWHDLQRRFYVHNYPDINELFSIVVHAKGEAAKSGEIQRPIARLWERRTSDADFGYVRLGIGTLPSTVTYSLKGTEDRSSHLTRAALKLDADSRFVTDVPVVISLRKPTERR